MTTYVKAPLSGSTNGLGINVTATASNGTTIHTAVAGTGGSMDEIWTWGVNLATTAVEIVMEYGGTGDTARIPYTIPARNGLHLLTPGLILRNALVVKAFNLTTAGAISIHGFVNSIVT